MKILLTTNAQYMVVSNKMWMVEVACIHDDGFYQNTCTCGVIEKDTVPCMHVMAVKKSKLIYESATTNGKFQRVHCQ